ncbi:GNAT family N-acetyltransferase [Thalassorhabdomicrobium marinisediminis]|uniref:GNAT family N-acetyltransferase n=1 Tax=Thalassorhabdomicrobium marinisediminis TaxID=2170577 RepID=UPI002491C231|nr:GNAT family N-acetyltransferase [Thalassorhabdomicrobium marinisediminis]
MTAHRVSAGFTPAERAEIAELYWQAFGDKLGRIMGPAPRALRFIEDVLDPAHALVARDPQGALQGVVGFKTYHGALVTGGWREMARHYGWLGSTWRIGLLALLERDVENERFLLDGIFVRPAARGQGVGRALLEATYAEAAQRGYKEVRLDVADSNPRARALYEREGFVALDEHHLGPLRHVFGFNSATTMVRQV